MNIGEDGRTAGIVLHSSPWYNDYIGTNMEDCMAAWAINIGHTETYNLIDKRSGNPDETGRQIAHAMAHGVYQCKKYVILYDAPSGTFSVMMR